jgi:hypothetical protein
MKPSVFGGSTPDAANRTAVPPYCANDVLMPNPIGARLTPENVGPGWQPGPDQIEQLLNLPDVGGKK